MKIRGVIFSLLMLLAFTVNAQDHVFKVLATKGDIKVENDGKTEVLKFGDMVYKTSKIVVPENGYVGMIHRAGKPFEIKKAGTFDVEVLANDLNTAKVGTLQKYTTLVVDNAKKGSSSSAVTGSVERALLGKGPIKLYAPKKVFVNKSTVSMLKWTAYEAAKEGYIVKIMDFTEEVIFEKETKATSIELDLTNVELDGEHFLVIVEVKGNSKIKSETCNIDLVSEKKAKEIDADLKEMKEQVDTGSAIGNIVMASYFEDNDLVLDAVASYEKAMTIAPNVDGYKLAYQNFLVRKGLTK